MVLPQLDVMSLNNDDDDNEENFGLCNRPIQGSYIRRESQPFKKKLGRNTWQPVNASGLWASGVGVVVGGGGRHLNTE